MPSEAGGSKDEAIRVVFQSKIDDINLVSIKIDDINVAHLKKTSSMVVTERPRFRKSRFFLFLSKSSKRAGKFLASDIGRLKTSSPLAVLFKDEP